MDRFTKEQRHRCMSAIRSKDTKPEMIVRKYLFGKGFRYRLHHPGLPGHPDIVLRKYRTVIFVNGCFWHGHEGCRHFVLPKSNVGFWKAKIERNRLRDKSEREELNAMGWHCLTVWECQLAAGRRDATLSAIEGRLRSNLLLRDIAGSPVTDVVAGVASVQAGSYDFTSEEPDVVAAESEAVYGKGLGPGRV